MPGKRLVFRTIGFPSIIRSSPQPQLSTTISEAAFRGLICPPSGAAAPLPSPVANARKLHGLLVAKGANDAFDFMTGFIGTPRLVDRRRILRGDRARFGLVAARLRLRHVSARGLHGGTTRGDNKHDIGRLRARAGARLPRRRLAKRFGQRARTAAVDAPRFLCSEVGGKPLPFRLPPPIVFALSVALHQALSSRHSVSRLILISGSYAVSPCYCCNTANQTPMTDPQRTLRVDFGADFAPPNTNSAARPGLRCGGPTLHRRPIQPLRREDMRHKGATACWRSRSPNG